MANFPRAVIYGQVEEFRYTDSGMEIQVLVFGFQGYRKRIWMVFNQRFRNIRQGEYLKIRGCFDGDINNPAFWYGYEQNSDAEIFGVSEEKAKKSFCILYLSVKFMSMGCDDRGYYYDISYNSPHLQGDWNSNDNWEVRRFKRRTTRIYLTGKAVKTFYHYEKNEYYSWLTFYGEYGTNGYFVVSEIE